MVVVSTLAHTSSSSHELKRDLHQTHATQSAVLTCQMSLLKKRDHANLVNDNIMGKLCYIIELINLLG